MNGFRFPFPFFPIQFTKNGGLFQQSELDSLIRGLTTTEKRPTDLFLMSHGWNNNINEAKELYSGLAVQLATQIQNSSKLKERVFAICGILWPSKRFEDKDLIPSGAASLNDSIGNAKLASRIEDL